MDDVAIDQMHAGFFADPKNCHEGRSACAERRSFDCGVERVSSEVQLTLAVSFPVGSAFAHPLGWSLTKLLSNGTAKKLEEDDDYKNTWKDKRCRTEQSEGQLYFVDIFGIMIIAALFILLGAMLYWLSLESPPKDPKEPEVPDPEVPDPEVPQSWRHY